MVSLAGFTFTPALGWFRQKNLCLRLEKRQCWLKKKRCQNGPTENGNNKKNPFFSFLKNKKLPTIFVGQPNYSLGCNYLRIRRLIQCFFKLLGMIFQRQKKKKTANSFCCKAKFLSWPNCFVSKVSFQNKKLPSKSERANIGASLHSGRWSRQALLTSNEK